VEVLQRSMSGRKVALHKIRPCPQETTGTASLPNPNQQARSTEHFL
jgi:hypothetical protein